MPTTRRPSRAIAATLALGLLAAACGDDGAEEDGAGTTAASTTSSSVAPTSTVPPSADPALKAKAEAAVLKLTDFPDGWMDPGPEGGLSLELVWDELLGCMGVEEASGPALGIATSPTFLQGVGTQARSTVEYVPEARARTIAAALTGGDFTRCATEVFTEDAGRSAPEGGQPGPLTVLPLEFEALGQSTSATRITFEMRVDDFPIPISQDLIVVFEGGTVSRFTFINPGGPFPPALQRTLVETVVGRN